MLRSGSQTWAAPPAHQRPAAAAHLAGRSPVRQQVQTRRRVSIVLASGDVIATRLRRRRSACLVLAFASSRLALLQDGSAREGRRERTLPWLPGGPGMRRGRFGGKRGVGRTMKVSIT